MFDGSAKCLTVLQQGRSVWSVVVLVLVLLWLTAPANW